MKTIKKSKKVKVEILRTYVAGVQHTDYQLCSELKAGAEARLYWERSNAYDPNAIRVEVGGTKVGYIPKTLTSNLHKYRQGGIKLYASVTAYNKYNPSWSAIHIKVEADTEIKNSDEVEL